MPTGPNPDVRMRGFRQRADVSAVLSLLDARLGPLPAEPFDPAEHATPRVDSKSLATVRQNQYSLPVRLAGLRVAARIGAREIVFVHDGQEVARHERLHGKFGTSAQLDHYLELLKLEPGALAPHVGRRKGARVVDPLRIRATELLGRRGVRRRGVPTRHLGDERAVRRR